MADSKSTPFRPRHGTRYTAEEAAAILIEVRAQPGGLTGEGVGRILHGYERPHRAVYYVMHRWREVAEGRRWVALHGRAPRAPKPPRPAPAAHAARWTPEVDAEMMELYRAGAGYKALARQLGRTRDAVRSRIRELTGAGRESRRRPRTGTSSG